MGKIFQTLKRIYTNPLYITANVVSFIVYYYIIMFMIKIQSNNNLILFTTPYTQYLLYIVAFSTSILLTIGIYSIKNSRKTNIVSSSAVVSSTALVQGLVVGCGCTSPVIFGIFGLVLGSAAATYLDIFLSNNQIPIFLVLIAINLSMSWYYLNKLSSKSCRVKKQ